MGRHAVTVPLVTVEVVVLAPDVPPRPHLDRPAAVCFCGRPLPLVEWRCTVCGWIPPRVRRRPRFELDPFLEQVRASLR